MNDHTAINSDDASLNPGLYDLLLTQGLEQKLGHVIENNLHEYGSVDDEESHSVLAQHLEHLLVSCLANYRGAEKANQQKRLVD